MMVSNLHPVCDWYTGGVGTVVGNWINFFKKNLKFLLAAVNIAASRQWLLYIRESNGAAI
jgi:hypothetical protein